MRRAASFWPMRLPHAVDTYKPDVIVDIATLTGAAVIAGHVAAAILGTDDILVDELAAGEATARTPVAPSLWKDYERQWKALLPISAISGLNAKRERLQAPRS